MTIGRATSRGGMTGRGMIGHAMISGATSRGGMIGLGTTGRARINVAMSRGATIGVATNGRGMSRPGTSSVGLRSSSRCRVGR